LGIMGSRMAVHLARAGHDLAVWNRTAATAEAWAAAHGARAAATPAAAADGADAVISIVVDGPQVEAVLLGPDGAASTAAPGALLIDMSTIAPATARAIGAALEARGLRFVDAPVTGSSPKAEAGTLTIMAGAAAADLEAARPLLEAMGETIVHVGAVGQGQMCKVIGNSLASANAVALGQALLACKATGVDLDAFVAAMRGGSGGSTMLELKAGPMRGHDYATLFKTAHMLKDVDHCLEATGAAGVPFPAAAQAREVLAGAVGRGFGDEDFAAVIEVLEGLAGLRL
ncbi:MAG: NAD(P)-dependent oxidoreductase, partial [Solirubrobacteraceae bacterium]|nr:NAD(P)-dependent oxidoreductase [Solirubrobacteraceae bacterium]